MTRLNTFTTDFVSDWPRSLAVNRVGPATVASVTGTGTLEKRLFVETFVHF